jgi:hypothetical protein
MTYITLPEIKSYLTISSDIHDANLALLANYACAVIESYIGHELVAANYTELHNGGYSSIFVDRVPINNVSSVLEYDGNQYVPLIGPLASDGSLNNNVSNANVVQFTWDSETGKITRDVGEGSGNYPVQLSSQVTFRNFVKGIKITYNGGYTLVPGDLKLATLDYLKILYKQDFSSSSSFRGESKTNSELTANFPPHIRRVLDLHRLL